MLSKINMPRDLVRNEERWKQAELDSSPREVETLNASPKLLSTPKRLFETAKSKLTKKPRWHNY